MHDIRNPWHGCVKISEGCKNCYMYALDKARGQDGRRIYRTADRTIPIQRDRQVDFLLALKDEDSLLSHGASLVISSMGSCC